MTDETTPPVAEEPKPRKEWIEEAEEALDRTSNALKSAWEASRETRMAALESATQAARELGVAIDKGLAAAKERWSGDEEAPSDEAAEVTEEE